MQKLSLYVKRWRGDLPASRACCFLMLGFGVQSVTHNIHHFVITMLPGQVLQSGCWAGSAWGALFLAAVVLMFVSLSVKTGHLSSSMSPPWVPQPPPSSALITWSPPPYMPWVVTGWVPRYIRVPLWPCEVEVNFVRHNCHCVRLIKIKGNVSGELTGKRMTNGFHPSWKFLLFSNSYYKHIVDAQLSSISPSAGESDSVQMSAGRYFLSLEPFHVVNPKRISLIFTIISLTITNYH